MSQNASLPAVALVLALVLPTGARAHTPPTHGGAQLAHGLGVLQQQQLGQQLALLNLEAARQHAFLQQEGVRQQVLLESQRAHERALVQERLERHQALERSLRRR